jgi:hypothetical protein
MRRIRWGKKQRGKAKRRETEVKRLLRERQKGWQWARYRWRETMGRQRGRDRGDEYRKRKIEGKIY